MEKKNTILLTVIAVATLLVAVVGATFAYFTASTAPSGDGSTGTVNTATVGNVTLEIANQTHDEQMEYPGGKAVVAFSVTPTKGGGDSNNYNVTYNVTGTIDTTALAESASTLTYKLYRVDSTTAASISDPVQSCVPIKDTTTQPGTTHYYYNSCAFDSKILGGEEVDSGTISNHSAVTQVKTDNLETSATGTTYYYYLVVDYPNVNSDKQNTDQGKSIKISLTGVTDGNATVAN